jgi:hypothetical protein
MYKVLDEDGVFDNNEPYEYQFETLKECYDFLRTQIHEKYQFRLIENGINKWEVERALKPLILKPKWYKTLFWTVEKVEDNGNV